MSLGALIIMDEMRFVNYFIDPCILYTVFNIFVSQSLREGQIPFEVSNNQPNSKKVAAMLEAERIAKDPMVKRYTDLDELMGLPH